MHSGPRSHHEVVLPVTTPLTHPKVAHVLYGHLVNAQPYMYPLTTWATHPTTARPNIVPYVCIVTALYVCTLTTQPYAHKVTVPPLHTKVVRTATTMALPTPSHARPTPTAQPQLCRRTCA